MKKILLSCVTCLLALGLVTACNNEDEDVSGGGGDSTTQDTGTGGGSDTGTGGGTTQGGGAEVVTSLSNYTLSFTLTGEEIPDYATLYITGDFNEWGFEALEVGEGVYTYTFDTITVDWHNFKLVMWYSDEEVDWDSGNYVEVVNEPWIDENGETQYGNAYFEVTASQGDDYTLDLEYEVSATLEPKVITVASISLSDTALSFAYEDIANAKTQTITASVIGSDGKVMEEEEVTWASDTVGVATVEAGEVTPVGPGDAVITATSKTNPDVKATCSVYVAESGVVLVDSIALDKETLALDLDTEQTTATLTATLAGENGAIPSNLGVTWTSSEESVATVEGDAEGTDDTAGTVTATVTALGPGETTITATSQEGGKTATCVVSVSGTLEYTITLTLKGPSGSAVVIPEDYSVYLVGAFDMTGSDWTLNSSYILTEVEADSGIYSVSVGTVAPGTYSCQLIADEVSAEEDWNHKLTDSFDITFSSTASIQVDVTTLYDEVAGAFPSGEGTNFYIAVIDTGSTQSNNLPSWCGFGCTNSFLHTTYSNYCEGAFTTNNGTYVAYSTSYATLEPTTGSDWFLLRATNGDDSITFGTVSDVPETDSGTYALLVGFADLSQLGGTTGQTIDTHYWIENISESTDIASYIASADFSSLTA